MIHPADDVRAFFASSDGVLDRLVLRPLSHITQNWELSWDHEAQAYAPEEDSFAAILNQLISDLANCRPPERYHDNEDRLAEYLREHLGWNIRDLPPAGPAVITRVHRFDIRAAPLSQARRV